MAGCSPLRLDLVELAEVVSMIESIIVYSLLLWGCCGAAKGCWLCIQILMEGDT